MNTQVTHTNRVAQAIDRIIDAGDFTRIFIIADTNTAKLVVPQLDSKSCTGAQLITIPAGEKNKSLETLSKIWTQFSDSGTTRNCLVINVGGGVVTDIGGMAAATFKRGMPFINCPTSLLAAVDAALGGKTGINFNGLKNEVGTFTDPLHTIISTRFLSTLPPHEIKAGYAEMLKHAMLHNNETFHRLLRNDFKQSFDTDEFLNEVKTSSAIKLQFVHIDPNDMGPRHALNYGHTFAHAFESLAMMRHKPISHGFAVAWGLVAETFLSHHICGFPAVDLYALAHFVLANYGAFKITCDNYETLIELMTHDKKSRHGEINCVLLSECGKPIYDQRISKDCAMAALDVYRDLMNI